MLIDVAIFSSTVAIVSYEAIKIKDKVTECLKRRKQIISEYDLVVGKDKLNRKIVVRQLYPFYRQLIKFTIYFLQIYTNIHLQEMNFKLAKLHDIHI